LCNVAVQFTPRVRCTESTANLHRNGTPMSAETRLTGPIDFPTPPLRPADLAALADAGLTWLWHGYLAARKVTALISQAKSGQTTLCSSPATTPAKRRSKPGVTYREAAQPRAPQPASSR
jgi:hypothetical protein